MGHWVGAAGVTTLLWTPVLGETDEESRWARAVGLGVLLGMEASLAEQWGRGLIWATPRLSRVSLCCPGPSSTS